MKKFIPFLLASIFLFVTMKALNHVNETNKLLIKTDSISSCSISIPLLPKEIIFHSRSQIIAQRANKVSSLSRLLPSDFKAHCYYNCKLLPMSNGLCFFPGGLSTSVASKPLYDEYWKRQFVQYL